MTPIKQTRRHTPSALSAFPSSLHFVYRKIQSLCLYLFVCFIICLTSLGLPGCDGGGVLRRGGGCALPLPLLLPGILCLHRHAVCHSQGMEANCLQVSSFSASLPQCPHFFLLQPSLCNFTYCMSQPEYKCVSECIYHCFFICTIVKNTNWGLKARCWAPGNGAQQLNNVKKWLIFQLQKANANGFCPCCYYFFSDNIYIF